MSLPRYPEYKDSGVAWLEEVPGHWDVRRVGYYFDERREKVSDKDFEALSVTKDGVVPQLETAAKTDYGENRKKVCTGDFVINSRSDRKGSSGASPLDGSVSLISTVLQPRDEISIQFAHHLFRSQPFQEEYYRYGKGIVADLWSTNYSEMKNINLAVPPVPEQQTIAAFLDRETGKIDALITEQRRLVELLAEKRQTVISHAVTKGVNPNAPMKDSGIEWLGEVPEHWEVTRLRRICSEINDINHEMPDAVESGVPFLSAKDLFDDGKLNFTTDIKMISEEDFAKLSRKICPRRGDIIYSRIGACLGKARLVGTDMRFLVSYSCCVIRVTESKGSRRFIQHLLDGEMILTEARMRTQGIGVPDLGLGEIGRFPVPLPPMQEQEDIADFLDEQARKFGTLTTEANRAISLLQEHRTALISASVTGKIDVRNN